MSCGARTTRNLGAGRWQINRVGLADIGRAHRTALALTGLGRGAMKRVQMPRTRYRAVLATFATLLVTALALGDLVRGIHLLSVPHVVCLEHGELMEAADPAGAITTTGVRWKFPAFTRQHSVIEHRAHCAIAVKPANLVWYSARPGLVVSLVEAPRDRTSFVFEGNAVRLGSILADAPKQSPPV